MHMNFAKDLMNLRDLNLFHFIHMFATLFSCFECDKSGVLQNLFHSYQAFSDYFLF